MTGVRALLATALLAFVTLAAPAQAETRVTLGFDDATAKQLDAATLVEAAGLRATFYVNSGAIGRPGRLTWDDVRGLADRGHEIGGHGVTHTDLTSITGDELRETVCDDRDALLDQGLAISSFAYPNGRVNTEARDVVRDCGYATARQVGGVFPSALCTPPGPCPFAETFAPRDPLATRTAPPANRGWGVTRLQEAVMRAERTGGWLQLIFHRLDDSDPGAITSATLSAFTRWLAERAVLGTTVMTAADAASAAPPETAHLAPVTSVSTRITRAALRQARPLVRCASACVVEVSVSATTASAARLGVRAGIPIATGRKILTRAGVAAVRPVPLPGAADAWADADERVELRYRSSVTSSGGLAVARGTRASPRG